MTDQGESNEMNTGAGKRRLESSTENGNLDKRPRTSEMEEWVPNSSELQAKKDELIKAQKEFKALLKQEWMKMEKMEADNQEMKKFENVVRNLFQKLLKENGESDKITLSLTEMIPEIEKMFAEKKDEMKKFEEFGICRHVPNLNTEINHLRKYSTSLEEKVNRLTVENGFFKDFFGKIGFWFVQVLGADNQQEGPFALNTEMFPRVQKKFEEYKKEAREMEEIRKLLDQVEDLIGADGARNEEECGEGRDEENVVFGESASNGV